MTQVNLGTANEFIARHIGPRAGDEQAMLNSLGFDSLEALSPASSRKASRAQRARHG